MHIFEPRYRQLFRELEARPATFGLPYGASSNTRDLVSICTLVKVCKRYANGASDVVIVAEDLGFLRSYEPVFPGKPYPGGVVGPLDAPFLHARPNQELMAAFAEYMLLKHGTRMDEQELLQCQLADLASSVSMSNDDKAKLVLLTDHKKQIGYLLKVLRYLNLLQRQEKRFENGFILN